MASQAQELAAPLGTGLFRFAPKKSGSLQRHLSRLVILGREGDSRQNLGDLRNRSYPFSLDLVVVTFSLLVEKHALEVRNLDV